MPYYTSGRVRSGPQGGPADRAALASFDDAIAAYRRGHYNGIGLAMMPEAGLIGIDLDACIDDNGGYTPLAQEIIAACPTYCERSPSGKGLRLFYFGALSNKKNVPDGIEAFCSKGYLTVTGHRVNGAVVLEMPPALRARVEQALGRGARSAAPVESGGVPAATAGTSNYRRTIPLETVRAALQILPADDRSDWVNYGAALKHDYGEAGREVWLEWSQKSAKWQPGDAALWETFDRNADAAPVTCVSILYAARLRAVTLDDFYAHLPTHDYLLHPDARAVARGERQRALAAGEGARWRPRVKAAAWLDRNRAVQQMTWAPGKPLLIADLLMNDGGWIQHAGAACFNQYLPPVACDGDPDKAGRWVEHVRRVYPDDALHILNWLGHRVPAARRENQSRTRLRRRAGHRQRYDPCAGEGCGRAVELPRSLAAAPAGGFQSVRQVRNPADKRGARLRRRGPVCLLRSHEDLYRCAPRHAPVQ